MAIEDVLPGSVGDVLAYRNLWNDYVMSSIRAMNVCADSFDTVAKDPPAGYTAQQLTDYAASYRKVANLYLQDWNQFSGTGALDIIAQAKVILNAQQDLVKRVGAMHTPDTMCKNLLAIEPPGLDLQNSVVSRLESLGIVSQGVLQFFTKSTATGLEVIAKEAVAPIIGGASKTLWDVVPWWGWVAGAGVALVMVGPSIAMVAAPVLAARRS
jgi:hypothetical protein